MALSSWGLCTRQKKVLARLFLWNGTAGLHQLPRSTHRTCAISCPVDSSLPTRLSSSAAHSVGSHGPASGTLPSPSLRRLCSVAHINSTTPFSGR
ncbi:hypothetical protein BCR44DRAFT_1434650 [Catenaria anguillulae PL171]|uniref:Uncharacterized protein n=1 Tax=Catenaria anguillulae PL171 TaxID=765915 RepID=A0A1Y2HKV8_9FUNG|nr:hypothetical protein BCR44DRAFT_1434650 [Catenaria anguillulae PL171]